MLINIVVKSKVQVVSKLASICAKNTTRKPKNLAR